jgi:hypothetical protein
MGDEQRELQRRWAAADAFAGWSPAWPGSNYQSADLQIAAASTEAIVRGDFLIVLGDFHGGANPLGQGVFGLRHPDPPAMLRRIADEAGPSVHLSPPRHGVVAMTARNWPLYPPGDIVVAGRQEPVPAGTQRVALEDVVIDGGHVRDRAGTFRVPLADLLYLPIFIAAVRSFDPAGPGAGRAQVGRLVVRRATWSAPGGELPADLPRRVFVRSPVVRKPRYVDLESPALRRTLKRFVARAPMIEFSEMLPGADECWLESAAGHHTCELRVTATDQRATVRSSSANSSV